MLSCGLLFFHSFFDVGGHSLLATKVISRLRRTFNVALNVKDLFNSPCATQLAAFIDAKALNFDTAVHRPIQRLDHDELSPLSFSQERLFFLDQLNPGNNWWFISLSLHISGELNISALNEAMNDIRRRHENLRSIFPSHNGVPGIKVLDFVAENIPFTALTSETDPEEVLSAHLDKEKGTAFDLTKELPFRVHLYQLRDDLFCLSMSIHHIVYDGYSLSIIQHELGVLYNQYAKGEAPTLPLLPIQVSFLPSNPCSSEHSYFAVPRLCKVAEIT